MMYTFFWQCMHDKNLHIIVAPTDLGYAEAIAKFQVDMAIESEGLDLDYQRTLKGVQSVLQDENKEICEASNIKTIIIDNDFLFISKK